MLCLSRAFRYSEMAWRRKEIDPVLASNVALDYQFAPGGLVGGQGSPASQQLRVEVKLGDRSTKRVQRMFGGLQLESTPFTLII
ncbi:hypothetical protein LSTR_LSTR017588 [Laodelphax striatellus]|uniref:Uncharacterized protein n=1 Tax=Laodelphax striatellus TaxID=195883 RepID=A0A482XAY2_LAOST|nr:hypothetical protein LSTR_LSTR017588 [Laodelphax striatellus]